MRSGRAVKRCHLMAAAAAGGGGGAAAHNDDDGDVTWRAAH